MTPWSLNGVFGRGNPTCSGLLLLAAADDMGLAGERDKRAADALAFKRDFTTGDAGDAGVVDRGERVGGAA